MGQHKQNKGIAMITAIVFLAIMMAIMGIGTVVGLSNYRLAKDNKATIQAEHAADSAVERAIFELWHIPNHFAKQNGLGDQLAMNKYKAALDGTLDLGIDLPVLPAGADSTFGNSFELTGILDNGATFEAAVRRKDVGNSVILNVVAKGIIGNSERYVTQTLTFGSANLWDFAILTDNIECTFCHLEVYSIEAGYKPDGQLRNFFKDSLADINGFERVRVGSLSKLELEGGSIAEADSYIMGTLYSGGYNNFWQHDAMTVYTVGLQENSSKLQTGNDFDSSFQKIYDWRNKPNGIQHCNQIDCSAFGQLYRDYPKVDEGQPDGLLQDSFPLPVEDSNSDRLIDNREWDRSIVGGGSVSVKRKGSVTSILETTDSSGIILVPHNEKLGQVTKSQKSFNSSSAKTSFSGNHAILRGTPGNPLEFDGKVYVDGDVVISGRVSGNGMIIARGNIYIVGDIVYDCGRNPCDYTQPSTLPKFALAAVGNITSGLYGFGTSHKNSDVYTTPSSTSNGYTSPSVISLFDSSTGKYTNRFQAQDFGAIVNSNISSLASMQIAMFNKVEYQRALDDSSYIPRFYLFRQGQHDYMTRCYHKCVVHNTHEFTSLVGLDIISRDLQAQEIYFNNNSATPAQLQNTRYDSSTDLDIFNRAVFVSLSPKDHWLLGKYGVDEIVYRTQFPTTSCDEATVEQYITDKLFSVNISNGQQDLGEYIKANSFGDCYHVAVARERLRAMNSEIVLKEMWRTYVEDQGAREQIINKAVDGDSFRVDGIIYTGSAFFFISPNTSVTKGEAIVNGSFIAADMGVLVGGSKTDRHLTRSTDRAEQDARGLRIQYDRRLIELISDVGESVDIGKSSFEIITASEAQQILGGQ